MELEDAIEKLKDKTQLVRDMGAAGLQSFLNEPRDGDSTWKQTALESLPQKVKELIGSATWHERCGGFQAGKVLLPYYPVDSQFAGAMEKLSLEFLDDSEVRVRMAVGECFHVLAQQEGKGVYERLKEELYKIIQSNVDVENKLSSEAGKEIIESDVVEGKNKSLDLQQIQELLSKEKRLDTSLKALQRLLEGYTSSVQLNVDDKMWELVRVILEHRSRFVRETGNFAAASLVKSASSDSFQRNAEIIAEGLAVGLADCWSPVRYAASIATRTFMCRASAFKHTIYPQLLPAMCFNRYDAAEGVRLYSQETWKQALGEKGREEVGSHIAGVVKHYISMSCSENSQIRETSCHCIGELLVKIDHEKVLPHVRSLIVALMNCYQDLSWQVRDAACSGLGKAITTFQDETQLLSKKLFELLFLHLGDKAPSVRENTAFVLGTAMTLHNMEAVNEVVAKLHDIFERSEKLSEIHHCHTFTHGSEKPCCSKAEAHATPVAEATSNSISWEESDGAIYLLRELSKVAPDRAIGFLPILAKLTQSPGFERNQYLLETLYRLLPLIAQNVGKKQFKPYLQLYINPLFSALTSGQRLAETASGTCISKLMTFIGPNIFRSRLDEFQLRALQARPFLCSTHGQN